MSYTIASLTRLATLPRRHPEFAAQLDEGKVLAETVADVKDANKRGALHFAAREGQTEVCKFLLEELKLNVDTKDEDARESVQQFLNAACIGNLDLFRKKLAGSQEWFGPGSRIIITTRDRKLLLARDEVQIHEASVLDYIEATKLFCSKAFNDMCPPEDFKELSDQVIYYCGGLPLALVVLGSALHREDLDVWKDSLQKLRKVGPDGGIVLGRERNVLDPHERQYTIEVATDAFRKMTKLRLLEIHNTCISKGPDYLPDELRWIVWDEYPSNYLPTTFEADNLVGLQLRWSRLRQLWEGRTRMIDEWKNPQFLSLRALQWCDEE
ncbi:hypothetical protein LguiB_020699 [Lonicera macranthoides]